MIQAPPAVFVRAPVGHLCVVGTAFLWCASPSLAGAFLWGRQSEAETRAILEIFDLGLRAMSPSFDVILDTRGVEAVDPVPLGVLFSWLVRNTDHLARRLRMQACVIPEGPIGLLLTGLLPVTGQAQPYRIFKRSSDAFSVVAGADGAALYAEVEEVADQLRGVPYEVRVTREVLAARIDASIDDVSRGLGMSSRSLQRVLGRHGTTFHEEVVSARLALAQALLRGGDLKLADVSARVGISERALGLLFRAKTGLTPAEWRSVLLARAKRDAPDSSGFKPGPKDPWRAVSLSAEGLLLGLVFPPLLSVGPSAGQAYSGHWTQAIATSSIRTVALVAMGAAAFL